MADRFPIIIESTEQQIQELSAGDGLDLTKSGVVNANYVHSAGVNAGVVTATSFIGDGSQITNIPAGGGSLEATASGTLADGSTVIVNADGTVSVAGVQTTPQTSGTANTFNSQDSDFTPQSATFDSTNNKVIIAWEESNSGKIIVGDVNPSNNSITFGSEQNIISYTNYYYYSLTYNSNTGRVVAAFTDSSGNDHGYAIVGQVSGTSVNFGSAVKFNNGVTYDISITSLSDDKVVIVYRDYGNSNYGTAIVGTISGNSISYGSEYVFNSSYSTATGITYDSTNDRIVIGFRDEYNTANRSSAVVGSVSGTTITFGSVVRLNSSVSHGYYHSAVHDSSTGKTVIAFVDYNNSGKGTAVVGTVSGTSISFGSPVIFNNGSTNDVTTAFDSNSNQILIGFQDDSDADEPTTVIAGTVSGTTINFGTKLKLATTDGYRTAMTFDSNSNRAVIVYKDQDNSGSGVAIVYQSPVTTTNLTAENFIGISNGAYSDGQTATIQIAGSVDDAQSGLTPGQQYYVQGDGTLSETADSPSVLAGTAVAATKLMIG